MNFLITGGTGFIGTYLVSKLLSDGHEITVLTRGKKNPDPRVRIINSIDDIAYEQKIDVMINLAGAPIDWLWTKKYKKILLESRVSTTAELVKLTSKLTIKPKLLISASAIGYYGVSELKKDIVDESSNANNSFTHQLCKQWEDNALEMQNHSVRVCIARLGVVLGGTGGIIKKMKPAIKYGLGSILGGGGQYMSWISLDDVVRSFELFIKDNTTNGAYNITSPTPVTNEEFTRTFASVLNTKVRLRIPESIVKFIFGQMGKEILLSGKCVLPKKLQKKGFEFTYTNIKDCFTDIINNSSE